MEEGTEIQTGGVLIDDDGGDLGPLLPTEGAGKAGLRERIKMCCAALESKERHQECCFKVLEVHWFCNVFERPCLKAPLGFLLPIHRCHHGNR